MELHAIWNRIDQLEQLILSQAKEIDLLRRVVNSTQVSLQNFASNEPLNSHSKQANDYMLLSSQRHNNNNNHNRFSSTITSSHSHANLSEPSKAAATGQLQQKQQQQQQHYQHEPATIYKSYLMNPFVHPSTAIPPVVNRVVMRSQDANTMANVGNTSTANNNNNNSINNSMTRNPYGLNGGIGRAGELDQLTTMTRSLPANTRWSTGPSLLGTLPDLDPDMDDGPQSSRFSVAELMTCFCPCFSMC